MTASYAISTEDINGIPPDAAAATVAQSKKVNAAARFTAAVKAINAGPHENDHHDLVAE